MMITHWLNEFSDKVKNDRKNQIYQEVSKVVNVPKFEGWTKEDIALFVHNQHLLTGNCYSSTDLSIFDSLFTTKLVNCFVMNTRNDLISYNRIRKLNEKTILVQESEDICCKIRKSGKETDLLKDEDEDIDFLRKLDDEEPSITTNFFTLYRELDLETLRNIGVNAGTIVKATKQNFEQKLQDTIRIMESKVYPNTVPTGNLWVLTAKANKEMLEDLKKESFVLNYKIHECQYLTDDAILIGIKDPNMGSYFFAPYLLKQSKDGLEFVYAVKLLREGAKFYGRIEIG